MVKYGHLSSHRWRDEEAEGSIRYPITVKSDAFSFAFGNASLLSLHDRTLAIISLNERVFVEPGIRLACCTFQTSV